MMMKTLCAGLLVAMAATTFGCGSAVSPTAPPPAQEPAVVDDQAPAQPVEAAAVPEQAQQPTYSTQAVIVRRTYTRIYTRPHVYVRPLYRHPRIYVRPPIYHHPHIYVRPIYRHPRIYVRPSYRHPRVYVRPHRRY